MKSQKKAAIDRLRTKLIRETENYLGRHLNRRYRHGICRVWRPSDAPANQKENLLWGDSTRKVVPCGESDGPDHETQRRIQSDANSD